MDQVNLEKNIFEQALDLPKGERMAYLAATCEADLALFERIKALLAAHEGEAGFLPENPASPEVASVLTVVKSGDKIGRYKILQQIGEGGCGVVYMAEQEDPVRRRVALKVIKLGMDTKGVIARFEAERQALAMMDHPNIAKVLDAGATEAGRPFFVMELVRGTPITTYCDENNLNTSERLRLFVQVCKAIQHAHQKGVIHRDIKPSNILVTVNDGIPGPKVIDFGVAKATNQNRLTDKTFFTAFEQLIGTPAYMSPEQSGMSTDIDTRSDIYSLGVLLYELLTGKTPFDGQALVKAGVDEMRRTIREKEPATPSTCLSTLAKSEANAIAKRHKSELPALVSLLRGDLDCIVMKSLEKDRSRRYESTIGFAEDVQRYLNNEPVMARSPSQLYRFGKAIRRHKAVVAILAVLVLGAIVSAWQIGRTIDAQSERDLARQLTAVRTAELAARNGQWREAIRLWDQAEAAGYTDIIYLGLRRAEAWTVLSHAKRARAELDKLARSSDLGSRRGTVLLRLGEHELFDQANSEQGIEYVRKAVSAGLTQHEQTFAEGLLTNSTPAALELFRKTLQFEPYHHSAHRHSMGLEFLLGRYQELEIHIRLFRTLFPDDPSAGFLEAAALAASGRLAEATNHLVHLHDAVTSDLRAQLVSGFHLLASAAAHYNITNLLNNNKAAGLKRDPLDTNIMGVSSTYLPLPSTTAALRVPRLPCFQRYHEGAQALTALALPGFYTEPDQAIERIKTSWQRHPEALLPGLAAELLDAWQPREGPKSIALLTTQADLFQMAADSPSVLPTLPNWARYQAAKRQFELTRLAQTNSSAALRACLANTRRATAAADTSTTEYRAYFNMAYDLGDYDLARTLLSQWEDGQPGEVNALRARVKLELSAGAPGKALQLIDNLLRDEPGESWALDQKTIAIARLKQLLESATTKPDGH